MSFVEPTSARKQDLMERVEDIPTVAMLETPPSEGKHRPDTKTTTPDEKASESPSRLPATPRKNVIPPRRTSFDPGHQTPQTVHKNPLSSNDTSTRKLDQQVENRETQEDREAARVLDQTADTETQKLPVPERHSLFIEVPTTPLVAVKPVSLQTRQEFKLTRGWAFCLALLLIIVIINATTAGFGQFFGPQGWGSVFNSDGNNGNQKLLNEIGQQLLKHTPTPGATAQPTPAPPTSEQIVDALLSRMTLDQKLGQMMIVQFNGQDYSPQLDAMISQYQVGGVLFFQFNIGSKSQLTSLTSQMQHSASLPLIVSVDQEGGTVDRLVNLDGAQPSATSIGETGDPNKAYQQGVKDAQNLASYGFNLNLAPVVDVHTVYNSQLYLRTYGDTPSVVIEMAGAYLKGLQQSGKVLGTLKHFPGLGDVSVDPHVRPPDLTRSLNDLNAIDWAPYKSLISQGDVYAIMVTHEYVKALDANVPSSLSPQVINVLRNQMHYQGVIITDSLTMESINNYYTYGQAAAMAVEAGDDILMGAASPDDVAQMIDGIKQAMSSGKITQQQIDASVRRILLLKYQMGLLQINS
jgi:beta-N-acetylhexosaminidase